MASATATIQPPTIAVPPSTVHLPSAPSSSDPLLPPTATENPSFAGPVCLLPQEPSTSTPLNPGTPSAPSGGSQAKIQTHVDQAKNLLQSKGGKHGAWLAGQLQGQADALKKVPVVGDIHSNGTPRAFGVFKAGGAFSKDDQVKDESGNVLYYLSFPHNFGSSWTLTLFRGSSPQSPQLASLHKGGFNPNPLTKDNIAITLVEPQYNGFTTTLVRPSLVSSGREFTGLGGGKFKWKKENMLSQGLMCIDLTTGAVAASWEKSFATYHKDGKLLVSPAYITELDLLVATALALEELAREEEQKSGSGGMTSKKNLLGMGVKYLNKK